jgi:hypothetical protein
VSFFDEPAPSRAKLCPLPGRLLRLCLLSGVTTTSSNVASPGATFLEEADTAGLRVGVGVALELARRYMLCALASGDVAPAVSTPGDRVVALCGDCNLLLFSRFGTELGRPNAENSGDPVTFSTGAIRLRWKYPGFPPVRFQRRYISEIEPTIMTTTSAETPTAIPMTVVVAKPDALLPATNDGELEADVVGDRVAPTLKDGVAVAEGATYPSGTSRRTQPTAVNVNPVAHTSHAAPVYPTPLQHTHCADAATLVTQVPKPLQNFPFAAGHVTTAYGQSAGQPDIPFNVSGRSPLSHTPFPQSDAVTALVTAWMAAPVVAVVAFTSCVRSKDSGALLEPPYGFSTTVALKSEARTLEIDECRDNRRAALFTSTLTVLGSRPKAFPINTDSSLFSSGMLTESPLLLTCI